jgi:hypothetical protein
MQERMWTAVMVAGSSTRVVNTTASLNKNNAKQQVETKYSGYTLVALVPGSHAAGAVSYSGFHAGRLPNCS